MTVVKNLLGSGEGVGSGEETRRRHAHCVNGAQGRGSEGEGKSKEGKNCKLK